MPPVLGQKSVQTWSTLSTALESANFGSILGAESVGMGAESLTSGR
jgi:hypothetical protein